MLSSELIDLINGIEARAPVAAWSIDGIHVWPLIRIRLMFDLYYVGNTATPRPGGPAGLGARLTALARVLLRQRQAERADPGKNQPLHSPADALFVSDGVSFAKVGGLWCERFCDPLVDVLRQNGFRTSMLTPGVSFLVPRRSPSRFIQAQLRIAGLLSTVKARARPASREELPGYPDAVAYLAERGFPVDLPSSPELYRQVCRIRAYSAFFRKVISRTRPAVGIVVSYYGDEGMAFNHACRERGIPSVDLQHGLQGDLHAAYGRWTAVPEGGYALLPSHFWCWSAEDAASIAAWSTRTGGHHRAIVGGNLWLEAWRRGDSDLFRPHDTAIRTVKDRHSGTRHVLVTLQFNHDDPATLAPLLSAVRESGPDVFWWMRLHPGMLADREKVRELLQSTGNARWELDAASDHPLYAILRHVDAHVTHSSSAVIEAAELGVPSVIFSDVGRELFPGLIASGWAGVAADGGLLDVLREQIGKRDRGELADVSPPHPRDGVARVLAMAGALR